MQIWNLQKILSKKRDPITHLNFLLLLENNSSFHAGRFGAAAVAASANGGATGSATGSTGNGGNEMEEMEVDKEMEEEEEESNVGVVYGKYFALVTYDMSKIFLSLGRTFKFIKEVLIREYPLFREKMVTKIESFILSILFLTSFFWNMNACTF